MKQSLNAITAVQRTAYKERNFVTPEYLRNVDCWQHNGPRVLKKINKFFQVKYVCNNWLHNIFIHLSPLCKNYVYFPVFSLCVHV